MKLLFLILIFVSNYGFSQLDENKKIIDSRLISTNVSPKFIDGYKEEVKLSNKTFDTIKILYNEQDLAKLISVCNKKSGIDNNYFHKLSSHFNIGFKLTNSININNQEFFYDSKMKRLIIKTYSLDTLNKLIEVQFISDFNLIKNKLTQVINW